jgi:hypothetical protein
MTLSFELAKNYQYYVLGMDQSTTTELRASRKDIRRVGTTACDRSATNDAQVCVQLGFGEYQSEGEETKTCYPNKSAVHLGRIALQHRSQPI